MKQLFYFILLFAGFSSIHSCKDLIDEDGNPLVDLHNNTGLTGPRALYREITDADTIAEYHYSGLLLSRVLTDSASITDIMYSGDKVSKIDFRGFLDLDNNGKLDKDSVSYSQIFTYGVSGKIDKVSESRSVFRRTPPVIPGDPPGPQTLFRKTKTLYNLKYAASTSKLDSIIMRSGEDVSGVPFVYKNYSRTGYTYLGDNVSKVVRHYGPMSNDVFGAPTGKLGYDYANFDTQISAYTLLPFAYKISVILSTEMNDKRSLILSPNSPKRMAITDLTTPIPVPAVFSTDYHYDPQTYVTKGYGINYIYKPL
ncbi:MULTISPECIES: hypothetical protein [Chryseobacterium]|uniref:hypothetical protein n=1 Tax=Chryseobacterium TaxID=59732 RepID=UPI001557EDBC|nr:MULTISPECIES: hypothetical protein [unclassified Chryseobacterium]MDC8106300.1 hypothetical protein [Chryseobacterium sp. B21-037]MDQ1804806.1 hypothetical protein [Chryseobacterium sp. CKR4-1]WBV55519.1 hypothetical protein PFY10_14920 [Chryseobacterium daecheongense]